MKHIDEHTLELFILNAREIRSKRRSIENHLAHCAGCSEVVRRLKDIYENVDETLAAGKDLTAGAERRVVPVRRSLDVWTEPILSVAKTSPKEIVQIPGAFVPALWRRVNSFYHYDSNLNNIDVYNSANKLLWTVPASNTAIAERLETAAHLKYTTKVASPKRSYFSRTIRTPSIQLRRSHLISRRTRP